MEKLVEIMLNEGIDEDTICSIIESLMNEEAYEVDKNTDRIAYCRSILKNSKNKQEREAAQRILDQLAPKHESLSESCFNSIIELVEGLLGLNEDNEPKVRKNNKQRVTMRQDDPGRNKIGVQKHYNRVIHDDNPGNPYSPKYVKINGVKYSVDSRNFINQRLN